MLRSACLPAFRIVQWPLATFYFLAFLLYPLQPTLLTIPLSCVPGALFAPLLGKGHLSTTLRTGALPPFPRTSFSGLLSLQIIFFYNMTPPTPTPLPGTGPRWHTPPPRRFFFFVSLSFVNVFLGFLPILNDMFFLFFQPTFSHQNQRRTLVDFRTFPVPFFHESTHFFDFKKHAPPFLRSLFVRFLPPFF